MSCCLTLISYDSLAFSTLTGQGILHSRPKLGAATSAILSPDVVAKKIPGIWRSFFQRLGRMFHLKDCKFDQDDLLHLLRPVIDLLLVLQLSASECGQEAHQKNYVHLFFSL